MHTQNTADRLQTVLDDADQVGGEALALREMADALEKLTLAIGARDHYELTEGNNSLRTKIAGDRVISADARAKAACERWMSFVNNRGAGVHTVGGAA